MFAPQDRRDAVVNREARRAAAGVLADYGVTDTVAIGAAAPAPDASPVPTSTGADSAGAAPTDTASRSRRAKFRALLGQWDSTPRDPHPLSTDGREVIRHSGPDVVDVDSGSYYPGSRYR